MCGIAGILQVSGKNPEKALLRKMIREVHHRGPDENGIFQNGRLGFSHSRLSIIDVESGQQPMQNPKSGMAITFNGEIFNHVELRNELKTKGHRFRTRSDTEVILHMYEEYGEECVQYFNGQWAFAVWDPNRQRVFLSRDRIGIRPLYYTWADGNFIFASEVKSLLKHPDVAPSVDIEALDDIFTFWVTIAPRTFYKGVSELAPGHNLIVTGEGNQKEQAYWQIDYHEPTITRTEDDYIEELKTLLADAVRLRLRSDVPVGAYLSGGLDSSLTVAMIKGFTDTPLKTFSVAFTDKDYDESRYQAAVVQYLDTKHATITCTGNEIGSTLR